MTASNRVKLKPGDTIGILGGGQLGRMLAMAAARLGLKCQVFSPEPDSPAFDVVLNAVCAEYADVERLELFAADVDVVTYEFENVPVESARWVSQLLPFGQEPFQLADAHGPFVDALAFALQLLRTYPSGHIWQRIAAFEHGKGFVELAVSD